MGLKLLKAFLQMGEGFFLRPFGSGGFPLSFSDIILL